MTELVFILDRSGSMSGLEKDTIGGFNSMLEKQRKEPGDAVVSTVLFDNETKVIHDRVAIADVPNLTDKEYIEHEFGYALNRTCDEIRLGYFHTETCMETVPEAITAFLEGNSFEDVIRTAVSLGGDCDTLTAIAGSIAEGFYGVPAELKEECYKRLPEPLLKVLKAFEEYLDRR